MTGGDDILYLITLRNLEIHLVIGLCCFEVFWDRAFNWLAMVPITLRLLIVCKTSRNIAISKGVYLTIWTINICPLTIL